MKTMPPASLISHVMPFYEEADIDLSQGPALIEVIPVYAPRCHTLKELAEQTTYLFKDFSEYDEKAQKKLFNGKSLEPMRLVTDKLTDLKDWTKETINATIRALSEEMGLGLGKIMQPMRLAVTGGTNSPSLDETLSLLGKEKTIARLSKAVIVIESTQDT